MPALSVVVGLVLVNPAILYSDLQESGNIVGKTRRVEFLFQLADNLGKIACAVTKFQDSAEL